MLNKVSLITEENAGEDLSHLHALCKIIEHNIPRCPDLSDLNIAKGLERV